MIFGGGSIIKAAMTKRGFKHRREDDQFSISGEYVRNLQYVYSKSYRTRDGVVVDLLYFGFDVLSEKLVIGFYRENPDIENGVLENASRSIKVEDLNLEVVDEALDKLIPPVHSDMK